MGINKTINRHWRDWAALVYLFICLVDFFIAPLMWNIGMNMQSDEIKMNTSRWAPLTLQAGAMFHLSFGAILGATAWRKKDEIQDKEIGELHTDLEGLKKTVKKHIVSGHHSTT